MSNETMRDEVAAILYEAGWRNFFDAKYSALLAAIPRLQAALTAQPVAVPATQQHTTADASGNVLTPAVIALDAAIHKVLIAGDDGGDELSDTHLRNTLEKAQHIAYRALISIGIERMPGAVNPLIAFLPAANVEALAQPAEVKCDCQNPEPENGPAMISNECPVHNFNPLKPPASGQPVAAQVSESIRDGYVLNRMVASGVDCDEQYYIDYRYKKPRIVAHPQAAQDKENEKWTRQKN